MSKNVNPSRLEELIENEQYAAVKALLVNLRLEQNEHEMPYVVLQLRLMIDACQNWMRYACNELVHLQRRDYRMVERHRENALHFNRLAARMRALAELIDDAGELMDAIACRLPAAAINDRAAA